MTRSTHTTTARWRDRPPGKSTLKDRATGLMRAALPLDEPDDAVLDRVEQRLFAERPQPLRSHLVFRVAVVILAVVAGGASVKAYEWVRQAAWPKRPAPPEQPAMARTRAKARHLAKPAPVEVVPPPAPNEDNPAAMEGPPAPPRPAAPPVPAAPPPAPATLAARTDHAPRTSPPPISPPTLLERALGPAAQPSPAAPGLHRPVPVAKPALGSDEITALDRAMAVLRRDHDAKAALAALDDYLRRYPNGFLRREALSGKVDALLLLRRSDQALAALETFPFDNHRRSLELLVIRGELHARKDCNRAIVDFDDALGRGPDAALLERILYGRGSCRARSGDKRGAVSDFRRYVERFPSGSHASWARRWLASNDKTDLQGR